MALDPVSLGKSDEPEESLEQFESPEIAIEIEEYYERQKEFEDMFGISALPKLPEVPLSHCDSFLEKVGLFYECAFNWIATGQFTYTNNNLPW